MARAAARNKGVDQTALDINPQKELITPLQAHVEAWIGAGYPGVSELSRRLLTYWFGGPHLLADGKTFFLWHPHQRRAVETTIYLYEVEKLRRTEEYWGLVGQQRASQKAPWAKIGLQMATGSGKTKVMSLLMVWAHLHWQFGDGDNALGFGNTQLLLAPNLIVLERLLADFAGGAIFANDPLLPPELRGEFTLQVVTPDNVPAECQPSAGYLIVTNIQKLYPDDSSQTDAPIPDDDPLFDLFSPDGPGTPTKLDIGTPRLLDFVQSVQSPLLVFNDEAHHVHDEGVHYGSKSVAAVKDEDVKEGIAWNRVLTGIQKRHGLSLQLDLSATLFEETTRQWFRHTVYDYPLQQAIKEGIVKQPFMGKIALQYKDGNLDEPIPLVDDSATNAFDKYTQLIQAGIAEWKKEQTALDFAGIDRKALLFIVCSNKAEAAQIAQRLEEFPDAETGECLFAGKVIEIHIGRKEATNEKEWQRIREEINRVDSGDSPYTAIVSVMMLKEGWDVRNVKVIVPLRPCDSRQLTEQLLGRGLRRMFPPIWNAEGERRDGSRAEGLYVIRHPSFERIIKNIADIIEDEPDDARRPDPARVLVKMVEPEEERVKRDLPISMIVGAFETDDDWIERIGRGSMPPLSHRFPYVQDLKEIEGIIKHEGAAGADVIAEAPLKYTVQATGYASIDAVISAYAEAIRAELRMTGSYTPAIKATVKSFLERCTFDLRGIPLSLEAAAEYDDDTRQIVIDNIRRGPVKQQVIQNVAKIIGQARSGKETPDVQVSTKHAKDLAEYEASPTPNILRHPEKSVHTLCCFDSSDELKFAQMLDEADDVASWLWNDQSGVGFRIQYSFEGRMPYYYPDFLVRLTNGSLYIVESKGSIRERDRAKQSRAERYADILREATDEDWRYIFLVNDSSIGRQDIAWWRQQGRTMFRDLVACTQNAATARL